MAPRARLWNILRNDRAKNSFHWVLLPLKLLGSGLWLLAPHIRPEEILLDQPIELPEAPDGAASKPALDETSSVSHKVLVATTVRFRVDAARAVRVDIRKAFGVIVRI